MRGNVTKLTDAKDQDTEFEYDKVGRVTRVVNEHSDLGTGRFGTEIYYADTMDAQVTMVRVPDHEEEEGVSYLEVKPQYDAMGRVTLVDLPDGEFDPLFSYDVNSQVGGAWDEANGTALGLSGDTVANWEFKYDIEGRMTQELLSGVNGQTLYPLGRRKVEYDAVGRRTKTTFYSQSSRSGYLGIDTDQTYSYDSTKHRLTQIQREASGSEKAQYAYDDSTGRVTKITYGTGARAEYDGGIAQSREKVWNSTFRLTLSQGRSLPESHFRKREKEQQINLKVGFRTKRPSSCFIQVVQRITQDFGARHFSS